jgi:hypothetical protein
MKTASSAKAELLGSSLLVFAINIGERFIEKNFSSPSA